MIVPAILLSSLAVFWGVSLLNAVKHRGTDASRLSDENPLSPMFSLALIGTLVMFAEALVFSYLGIFGPKSAIIGTLFKPSGGVSLLGAIVFSSGCLLHAWSVRVRGRNAVSWVMPEDHRIITEPPYDIVRHPSYLGYMLMIVGMTISWGNIVTLVPWVAIPGYYFVSLYEESMLIERFGEEYRDYMKRVNGFIPRT
jgi:protein-S-isoprenylcysteine O-methyltransferase Ste14